MGRGWWWSVVGLLGCGGSEPSLDSGSTPPEEACAYPAGAGDTLTLNGIMPTWRWDDARHMDGRTASLEVRRIPCASDDDIDWSPFDVLLFVSIPAW